MLELLLRLPAEAGPEVAWIAGFFMAVVAVFVLYIGIAMLATLRAGDPARREVCYQVFRALLELFRRRG